MSVHQYQEHGLHLEFDGIMNEVVEGQTQLRSENTGLQAERELISSSTLVTFYQSHSKILHNLFFTMHYNSDYADVRSALLPLLPLDLAQLGSLEI